MAATCLVPEVVVVVIPSQGNSNVTVTDTDPDGTIIFDTEGTDGWAFTSAGHLLPMQMLPMILEVHYKVRHPFLSDSLPL